MPSTIEANPTSINANSYATIEEADAYMDDLFEDGGWSTLDEDSKTRLLLSATKMIDKFKIVFEKKNTLRLLKFPVKNENDELIDGMKEAKEATILQAAYSFAYANQIEYAQKAAITGITGESYSSETNVSRKPSYSPYRKYAPNVHVLLSMFIDISVSLSRG